MWLTRVRRTSYGVTAALSVTLLSASCTSATAGPATTHITVGALPVVDNVGLYIAADEGIFRQVGLRVTIEQVLQSTAAIPEMKGGAINIIGGANNVSFMQAAAKDPGDPPFRLVMEAATCAPGTFDVLTLPSSRIARPADLAGKKIAVNLTDNVQTLTINAILRDHGVNPASLHYVVVPFPEMIAALEAHKVDAISAVEPSPPRPNSPPERCPCSISVRGRPTTSRYRATTPPAPGRGSIPPPSPPSRKPWRGPRPLPTTAGVSWRRPS
jgi:ABC-type nitrate/sulfonate/bicarbonate transport system substrate-binding protein